MQKRKCFTEQHFYTTNTAERFLINEVTANQDGDNRTVAVSTGRSMGIRKREDAKGEQLYSEETLYSFDNFLPKFNKVPLMTRFIRVGTRQRALEQTSPLFHPVAN